MNDDVVKFKRLGMTVEQILEFNYEITGPKSSAQTARDSRNSTMTYNDQNRGSLNFQLNYNVVMLACQYGSAKLLEWLHDNVVLRSQNPKKTRLDLLQSSQ